VVVTMPRNQEQNKLIRDERREQILNAAMVVFAKKGFAATKISDIIAATGLSHGLVYHYFKSKEEIYYAVIQQTIDLSRVANEKISYIPGNTLDKIRIFTERALNNSKDDNTLRFLLIVQLYLSDTESTEIKDMIEDSYAPVLLMEGLISEGQKKGEIIEGNPRMLATTYWAAFIGLMLVSYNDSSIFEMPNADVIMRMLKA
jgi:AcrR family transcriptional regulator